MSGGRAEQLFRIMVCREEEIEAIMWAAGYQAGKEDASRVDIPGLWEENPLLDRMARRLAGREEWPKK